MFENLKLEGINFYRGEIPFFIKKADKNLVYLCSSKKNLNDYYWCLKDFTDVKIIKQEENTEEEYIKFNYKIIEALKNNERFIILITLDYFLKKYRYHGNSLLIENGKKLDLKKTIKMFDSEGYKRNYLIEGREEYSIRGDILDFFPVNSEAPIRVELFDDEIERISYFSVDTQKSIEKLNQVDVYIDNNKDAVENFLEHFKDTETNNKKIKLELFLENREVLEYKLKEIIESSDVSEEERLNQCFFNGIKDFKELKNQIFKNNEIQRYQDYEEIKKISKEKKIVICSEENRRYLEIFSEYSNIEYYHYPLYEGFENNGTLYLTDRELKGIRVKREKNTNKIVKHTNISEIKEGDYLIHESFGLGIYKGLSIINGQEYLEIKYADEDKLFVSTNNLDRIEKYIVDIGQEPEIYRLGRKGFKKRREKLQEEIAVFAHEIIEIQVKRMTNKGFKFTRDNLLQEEFEESFPYTLTRDQVKAIDDVKKDMESEKVMDRIVCGDVGCGKTEVAIRAAFKAVNDEKQVVIMVPTTVLAQQHYERVKERFKNYPFTVELLSRVKTEKEQTEIIRRISNGSVDIVIGTHKVLSEEIKFKDLGLAIIDEEQKFGVKAKEKLKQLKDNIDMLTLTATPIPRTLNLALLGIRDISIIETLPPNRLPIKDSYIEKNEKNIKDAIMKEYAREGQCFYLYNSVKKMEKKEQEIRSIIPDFIKIASIHGQMQPREIKSRVNSFESGDIDILLTTTIIENGIDIENANTIIIEGIEKLGLSQMYQLRGRVGRGSEQGYCYLIIDSTKESKSKVKEREQSMRSLDGISTGAGFHLSLEDIRIRGAGEILGEKQHGALEVLGYSLYMKMLQEEMDKLKGNYIKPISEFVMELKGDRHIPEEYMNKKERIGIYKRVARINKLGDLKEIENEVIDRFGRLPSVVKNYFRGEKIRILSAVENILEIKEQEDHCYIKFIGNDVKPEKIMELLQRGKIKYKKYENAIEYYGKLEDFFEYYKGI